VNFSHIPKFGILGCDSDENPESGNCNPESRNCHPESGNRNLDSGKNNPGKENDPQGEEPVPMDVNMVFMIPTEFRAPTFCRCHYSRSSATSKVILNVQILALAVLQVI
jgi:hypothetical protein